jgi:hypothetical protein
VIRIARLDFKIEIKGKIELNPEESRRLEKFLKAWSIKIIAWGLETEFIIYGGKNELYSITKRDGRKCCPPCLDSPRSIYSIPEETGLKIF